MKRWVKRLRGVLGIGSVWGLVSGVAGAAVGWISDFITGSLIGALVIGGGVAVGAGLPLVANLISIAVAGPAVPFAVLLPALLS